MAAAGHWGAITGAMFAAADYHRPADPAARVLAYIDLRAALLGDDLAASTCFLGTLVQETWDSHPVLRDACGAGIAAHAATLEADIAAAKAQCCPDADWPNADGPNADGPNADWPNADWDVASLALFTQTVLQGAFVVGKAVDSAEVARGQVAHLRRYVAMLLGKEG